eukprot:768429-Hanusia_phi.AAC.12
MSSCVTLIVLACQTNLVSLQHNTVCPARRKLLSRQMALLLEHSILFPKLNPYPAFSYSNVEPVRSHTSTRGRTDNEGTSWLTAFTS